MNPRRTYLSELASIRSTVLLSRDFLLRSARHLFNDLANVEAEIRCRHQSAGSRRRNPDGGLFTADQFKKPRLLNLSQASFRTGAIEIKPTSNDAWLTADGEQVSKYWGKYRQVLVTKLS